MDAWHERSCSRDACGDDRRDGPVCGERLERIYLHRSALVAWQTRDAAITLIVLAALGTLTCVSSLSGQPKAYLAGALVVALVVGASELIAFNALRFKRYAIDVYSNRVELSQGWLSREVTVIPKISVLSMRLRQGPVLRWLNLTYFTIVTIADQHRLGPLTPAQSRWLQHRLGGDLPGAVSE